MTKVLKFEATLTIDDDDAFIGRDDQSRNWFWQQVMDHSRLEVGGDLGDSPGAFSDIRISATTSDNEGG